MKILPNGKTQLDSKGELYYHMILEMGLGIDNLQHIYDQSTGNTLSWKDHYIKCAVNDQPVYAGKDEVVFTIDENFQLFMSIYAHYLDNLANDPDSDIIVVAHYIDFDEALQKNKLHIKFNSKDGSVTGGLITSDYYSDSWLCYIESIFLLNGNFGFDFHNFDQIRERK